jgi:hypothetical protein
MSGLVSEQKLPPPTTVWHTALTLVSTNSPAYGTLQGGMLVSLQRMAIGFALGENSVDPLMQMLRTVPAKAAAPAQVVLAKQGVGYGGDGGVAAEGRHQRPVSGHSKLASRSFVTPFVVRTCRDQDDTNRSFARLSGVVLRCR